MEKILEKLRLAQLKCKNEGRVFEAADALAAIAEDFVRKGNYEQFVDAASKIGSPPTSALAAPGLEVCATCGGAGVVYVLDAPGTAQDAQRPCPACTKPEASAEPCDGWKWSEAAQAHIPCPQHPPADVREDRICTAERERIVGLLKAEAATLRAYRDCEYDTEARALEAFAAKLGAEGT